VVEQKSTVCPSFGNLITVEVSTSAGMTIVAGTVMRGEAHIVRAGEFWIDIVPTGSYWLFIDHRDRPGFIGAVGVVTGEAGININTMHVSRLEPRGHAIMALGLDEPLSEVDRRRILDIADVYSVKAVKL
jgi:D-3-phosphoglycerate dehydrogenase